MNPRGGLLILGALLGAIGVCFLLLGDREPDAASGSRSEAPNEEFTPDDPMLVGSGDARSERDGSPEGSDGPDAKDAEPGRKPAPRTISVQIRGKGGNTIHIPRLIVETRNGNDKPRRRGVDVDADGRIRFEVDTRTPLRELRLIAQSTEGPRFERVVYKWNAGQGALPDAPHIELDVTFLRVRTVDSRGDPRPHQRILMRYASEGTANGSWWGESSDKDGWLVYGPFSPGTLVEFRPGWRGVKKEDLTDKMLAWQRVEVRDQVFEIFVGDQPRLKLKLTGVPEKAMVPFSILHRERGSLVLPSGLFVVTDQLWTAPALADGIPLEIVVGPTSDGLFARHTLDSLPHYPVAIHLASVPETTGEVTAPNGERIRRMRVQATGRGFVVERHFSGSGRFEFPGLPTERITYIVQAEIENRDGSATWLNAEHTSEGKTWVEIRIPAPKKRNKVAHAPAR